MSSSKNKRKRPENDSSGAAAPASRRRSRDQRAADEPGLVDNKNEQEENPCPTTTTEQMGEASVAQAPAQNRHEQGDSTGNTPRAESTRAMSADDTTSGEKTAEIPIKQGEDAGASSTSVEKVSTSLQEASKNSAEPAPSAASAPKTEDASKAGDPSRSAGGSLESRIQGLIAHRKILLNRIRLTRLACGKRLEATKSQGQAAGDSKLPVDKGAAPTEMTDDEEIEAHNEMARLASQAAKKSRQEAEGVQGEKRTSLSLRRGASVGKKMNAALSSLAPGAGAHQTLDAPATQPQHVTSLQPPNLSLKSAQVAGMPAKPPATSGISPPVRPMVVPQPQMVPSKSIKIISPPPMHQPNSKQMSAGANIQKQRAPNSKSMKVASTLNHKMSSAARPESATLPLHAGSNPSTLPPNRLAQKVHFPEAEALREKRSKLQAKLANLLERQGRIDPTAKESSTDRVSNSTAPATASPTRKKPPPKLPANWEPRNPALLPKKRKTHWDYVMQEMTWMATDFIEERKWKLSSARTIGLAIRTPGIAVMAPPGARAAEPSREKNGSAEMSSDFKDCKMEVEDNSVRKKADAPVAKPSFVKAKSQDSPRYIAPTMEDGKSARKVARIVCCMVSELISATLDSGAITRSDQSHREALGRYRQLRRKLITDKSGASLASITEADKKEHDKQATEKAEAAELENGVIRNGDKMEVEPAEEKNEVIEAKSFESITDYIETSLHQPAEGRSKSAKSEKPKVFSTEGLRLSSGQKEAIEFVEELWERKHSPGAILSGTAVSGKTIATCSILWKQRSNGPQLLLCPPARLIRWMHELGGFKDMRVLPFGLTSGISSPFPEKSDLDELSEGDVIVCEYSALPRLVGALGTDISKFHSFVIDCRHPVAFSVPYQSELEQKVSLPGEARKREWNCPPELISTVWWGDVLKFLLEGDARRLLIEFAKTDALSLSTSGLGDRQQLGILAFRAAYIIGPKIFQSPEVPIQKQVASWARRIGKKSTADKVARIRNLLEESTKAFRCDIQGFVSLEDVSTSSRANLRWELHHCSLPPCQRSAYDQSCAEVRGALSSSLASTHNDGESVFHSLKAVSCALLRLRRQCIHSNLRDIFTNSMMQNRLGPFCEAIMDQSFGRMSKNGRTGIFDRKLADSPSQPDSEIAFSILEGSAKLRKLVSILKYQCDYDLVGEEQLESLLHSEDREVPFKSSLKRKSSGPTKVAILAVLPEVQLLVSTLLNSVGIKHELLLRATSETRLSNGPRQTSDAGVEEASETERNQTSALAWAEFQTILSKFNSDHSIDKNSVDVVITSTAFIAGDNGGLGIEKAGLVICLDEDWSGRGELMMKYIAARWLARNKVISTDRCRLIRLVCEDTIEEKILTNEEPPKDESDGDVKPWPVDYSGHFLLPKLDTQAQVLYNHSPAVPSLNVCGFPGLNFLKFRGHLLSEVLVSSKDLPPMFGSGAKIRFLPLSESTIISGESSARHDEDEQIAEVAFLKDLLGRERIASLGLSAGGSNRLGTEESLKAVELAPFFVLPPSPSSFPAEMITRQDLTVVATRLYLERHAKLAVRSQLGIGSGRISLALLPDTVGTAAAATSSAPVAAPSATIKISSDLADSWAKSGLSCKPDDSALSLLFYSESSNDPSNDDDGHKVGHSKKVGSHHEKQGNSHMGTLSIEVSSAPRTARRGNSYSKSFSAARDGNVFQDGNQGSEALVYFPPLFPNMLLCSMQAGRDTEALLASKAAAIPEGTYDDSLDDNDLPFKRKELEAPEGHGAPNSKRLRVQQPSIPSVASTGITSPGQVLVPGALPAATQAATATAPLAHLNQSIATGPQHQMVPVPKTEVISDVRRIIDDDGASSALFGVDEDYGLLGIGAIPLPDDAALSAAHAFVGTSAFTYPSLGVGHAFFESANPCDAEEAEGVSRQNKKTSLNSMLLFVKKKSRGYAALPDKQGQLYRPPHGLPPRADAGWAGAHGLTPSALLPGGGNLPFAEMNGAISPKKVKKKPLNQGVGPMPSSAFSRLPSADGPQGRPLAPMPIAVQFSKGKDGFRHRILSSFVSRQIGTGLTMFESSSFRVAAVHVQNRVVDRLTERCWQSSSSYDAGSGLPLLVAKQLLGTGTAGKRVLDSDPNRWTSIVKRLKNSSETGDTARSISTSQRSALRRSLVSPCRVDFGPFRGGFLAQPSGMTGISPPRPRLGVALPMGVKVPQTLREQLHDAWTARDDQLLQDCAVRFGMNWMLVARALSGFEDAVMTANAVNASETNNEARSIGRSARQCRDRWQALARSQPSLANEVRKSERVLRERALLSPDQIRCESGNACRMSGAVIKGSGQNTTHLISKSSLFVKVLLKKSDLAGGISNSVAKDQAKPTVQNGNTEKEHVVSMDIDDLSKKQAVRLTTSSNEQDLKIDGLKKQKRMFTSISLAKTKKQIIPMTIPGVVTGSPPTLVPSHPSHMQAVQESLSAQMSSGRTEMWPLQILDFADTQRAAATAAQKPSSSGQRTAATAAAARSSTTTSASSSSSRRRPASSTSARSPLQASSDAQQQRPTPFPPVPASIARSVAQRPQVTSASPNRSPPNTSAATAKAYAPPQAVAQAKPGQAPPPSK